jgi:hypothetical protein
MSSRGKKGRFFENLARRRAAAVLADKRASPPGKCAGNMDVAGPSSAGSSSGLKSGKAFKQELERQKKEFLEEKRVVRESRQLERAVTRAAAEKDEQRSVLIDQEFAERHAEDTDEQLLEYLRQCALELGHPPTTREIIGGSYISERFVAWRIALWRAELPMAKGMQPPTESEKRAYMVGSLRQVLEAKKRREQVRRQKGK